MGTVPAFQLQNLTVKAVQATALEINCPALNANGATVNLTVSSSPGPFVTSFYYAPQIVDAKNPPGTEAMVNGNGFATLTTAAAFSVPVGNYNCVVSTIGADGIPRAMAYFVMQSVNGGKS